MTLSPDIAPEYWFDDSFDDLFDGGAPAVPEDRPPTDVEIPGEMVRDQQLSPFDLGIYALVLALLDDYEADITGALERRLPGDDVHAAITKLIAKGHLVRRPDAEAAG